MKIPLIVIVAMGMLFAASTAPAQIMLTRAVAASGGNISTNGSQAAGVTAGQAVTGTASNGQTVGRFGFWNTLAPAAAPSIVNTEPPLSMSVTEYPNPASNRATVEVTLETGGPFDLELYDMTGKQVLMLASGEHAAGNFELPLDLTSLPSGSYMLAARLPGQLLEHSISVVH